MEALKEHGERNELNYGNVRLQEKHVLSSFNAKCNSLIFLITFVMHCDLNMFLWDSTILSITGICLAACCTQVPFYWPTRSVPDQLVQQSFSAHLETEQWGHGEISEVSVALCQEQVNNEMLWAAGDDWKQEALQQNHE